jgi:hypothetical protein
MTTAAATKENELGKPAEIRETGPAAVDPKKALGSLLKEHSFSF